MFFGNHPAKIDDKGRLKIPGGFRSNLEKEYGSDVFVTSVTGQSVRIYPMPVWLALGQKMTSLGSEHPSRRRFFNRVNYYGQTTQIDAQGRVVIHQRLRESAGISGEVDVLGKQDLLEVWNSERFLAMLDNDPYTDEDARIIGDLGI